MYDGCMNGMITTHKYEVSEVIDKIKAFKVQGVVKACTCKEKNILLVQAE